MRKIDSILWDYNYTILSPKQSSRGIPILKRSNIFLSDLPPYCFLHLYTVLRPLRTLFYVRFMSFTCLNFCWWRIFVWKEPQFVLECLVILLIIFYFYLRQLLLLLLLILLTYIFTASSFGFTSFVFNFYFLLETIDIAFMR